MHNAYINWVYSILDPFLVSRVLLGCWHLLFMTPDSVYPGFFGL